MPSKTALRQRRLEVLERRAAFLETRVNEAAVSNKGFKSYDRAEIAALVWVIEVIKASILADTIDELERIAFGPVVELVDTGDLKSPAQA